MNKRVVHISDVELARLIIDSAETGEPLRVEIEGATFILHVAREKRSTEPDIWVNYDPGKVRKALDKDVGA